MALESLQEPHSWIIYNTMTDKAVFETFEKNTALAFEGGIGCYKSMPILNWLQFQNESAQQTRG